jgi:hypothetical protein
MLVRIASGPGRRQVVTTVTAPVCAECKSRHTLLQRIGYAGIVLALALFFLRRPLGLDLPAPWLPPLPVWLALGLVIVFLGGLPTLVFETRMKKRVDTWRSKYVR